MDPNSIRVMGAAAGAASSDPVYIEDVFSTHSYKGNGSSRELDNDIDLAGEGGMVWIKRRDGNANHDIQDTVRGANKVMYMNSFAGEETHTDHISSFDSDGFTLGDNSIVNINSGNYTSWTFRQQKGFFDIVSYTGNSPSSDPVAQTIAHNLGSVPGMMIVKSRSANRNWYVYHKSRGNEKHLRLDLNNAEAGSTAWDDTTPTATHFTVGPTDDVNKDGENFIAYLFADGIDSACKIFTESGDKEAIKCGAYTGNGSSSGHLIDCGFEPQWVLIKDISSGTEWNIFDSMRGVSDVMDARRLYANDDGTENGHMFAFRPSGFLLCEAGGINSNGQEYIYIAVRRGPMRTPTNAAKVFTPIASDTPVAVSYQRPEDVDMYWFTKRSVGFSDNMQVADRVRGFETTSAMSDDDHATPTLVTCNANGEFDSGSTIAQTRANDGGPLVTAASSGSTFMNYIFKRAPGFFDIVAYKGESDTAGLNVAHNLEVVPELIFFKRRNGTKNWYVYHSGVGTQKEMYFDLDNDPANAAGFIPTTPTATEITVQSYVHIFNQGDTYMAYLFASCPGVSKVGYYDGTASDVNVDCGFTGNARLVLIKRIDASGSWYLFDSERGIGSGNDPALSPDLTTEEDDQDYLSSYTGGFTVNSSAGTGVNADGGEYVFLAIA